MSITTVSSGFQYHGSELDVFRFATNWKRYYQRQIAPKIQGDVLEVGAGIGATTRTLCTGSERQWVCLEPDPGLAARIAEEHRRIPYPIAPEVIVGTLETLEPSRTFDTLLYIDVLEHIEDDADEFRRAAERLKPGGSLIILCPAHGWLFSEFDHAIGHYRRYDKVMMTQLPKRGLQLNQLFYLDCFGVILSLLNRLIRRKGAPSSALPILFWDRLVIPCSRVFDAIIGYRFGKTIVGIWSKPTDGSSNARADRS